MTKEHILQEIRRTAKANNSKPLGEQRFRAETGIKKSDWFGKHWARWNDALAEAGFGPNQLQTAYKDEYLFEKYIGLVRKLGRLPSGGDLRLETRMDSEFPSNTTFDKFGSKFDLAEKVLEHCRSRDDYDDIVTLCSEYISSTRTTPREGAASNGEEIGFVYLIKSGRFYKIGRSNAAGRREYELAIQLPEKASTVHTIRTDDPVGIEAYWHKRFEAKRKHGEWFELVAADIAAFKRRKFM
ncbi:MAG TPA: GIY-YIG nuclease family protein [Bdellovibrionota bacterium]|nr:GIY-YIG nuclease family protein [Bdellovibrionota bacterium]